MKQQIKVNESLLKTLLSDCQQITKKLNTDDSTKYNYQNIEYFSNIYNLNLRIK